MSAYCCIPGCKSVYRKRKTKGISFHEIPSNIELRNKWFEIISRYNRSPNDTSIYSRVCSNHFLPSDYKRCIARRRLINTAVPSQFPGSPKHTQPPLKKVRLFALIQNNISTLSSTTTSPKFSTAAIAKSSNEVIFQSNNEVIVQSNNEVIAQPNNEIRAESRNEVIAESTNEVTAESNNCVIAESNNEYEATVDKTVQVDVFQQKEKGEINTCKLMNKCCLSKLQLLQSDLAQSKKKICEFEANPYINSLQKILNDAANNNPSAIFLKDLILNYDKEKPKYERQTIQHALMWRSISTESYEYARQNINLKLPSRSSLIRCLRNLSCKKVFMSKPVKERIKAEIDDFTSKENLCSSIIDEVSIQE